MDRSTREREPATTRTATAGTTTTARVRPSTSTTTTTTTSLSASLPPTSTPRRPSANPLLASTTSSSTLHTSPHYATSLRSRHSLYGTEDRIILDLGSKIWKVGFSGEVNPRECVEFESSRGSSGEEEAGEAGGIWGLEKGEVEEEVWLVREERLKRGLRDVWFTHLMSDPKARKVIILEPPLLPLRIKELIAKVLFENLHVPSVNFASSSLLSLLAIGSVSGLVVDVGHLETTVLPISASRPLFPHLLTTPLAGSHLTTHLQSLLLLFSTYVPPPNSLNNTVPSKRGRVPKDVLTRELVEEIKRRVCFVADYGIGGGSDGEGGLGEEDVMEVDEPQSHEGERGEGEDESGLSKTQIAYLRRLEKHYRPLTTSTSLTIRIPNLNSQAHAPSGTQSTVTSALGRGHLLIPGWIREFGAEMLWRKGDVDRRSLVEVVLEVLLKLPIDLRKPMASSILVTGGTCMLPGFFSRMRNELLAALNASKPHSPPPSPTSSPPPPSSEPSSSSSTTTDETRRKKRHEELSRRLAIFRSTPPYAPLIPLLNHIAILNDPSATSTFPAPSRTDTPTPNTIPLHKNNGTAPNFSPSLLSWIGGSLAGALKIGGKEILREEWEKGGVAAGTTLGEAGIGLGLGLGSEDAAASVLGESGTGMEMEGNEEVILEEVKRVGRRGLVGDWSKERIIRGL